MYSDFYGGDLGCLCELRKKVDTYVVSFSYCLYKIRIENCPFDFCREGLDCLRACTAYS